MQVLVNLMLQAFLGLGLKLLTEKFISKAVVIALRECARRTENKWDDELVGAMDEALNDAREEPK